MSSSKDLQAISGHTTNHDPLILHFTFPDCLPTVPVDALSLRHKDAVRSEYFAPKSQQQQQTVQEH